MIDISFERFSNLGMTSAIAQHLSLQATPPGGPHTLARVIEVHRDALVLHDGDCAHTARLLPGLARALLEGASAPSAGDRVLCVTPTAKASSRPTSAQAKPWCCRDPPAQARAR